MKKELLWLIGIFITGIGLSYLLFLGIFKIGVDEIQSSDFDFIFKIWTLFLLICLLLIYLFYLIRGIIKRFNNLTSNFILLISNFLSIVISSIIINSELILFFTLGGGWTAYPPLSMPPKNATIMSSPIDSILLFWLLQFFMLITLVLVSVKTGKLIASKNQQ